MICGVALVLTRFFKVVSKGKDIKLASAATARLRRKKDTNERAFKEQGRISKFNDKPLYAGSSRRSNTNERIFKEQRQVSRLDERTFKEQRQISRPNGRTFKEQRQISRPNGRTSKEQRQISRPNERTFKEQRRISRPNERIIKVQRHISRSIDTRELQPNKRVISSKRDLPNQTKSSAVINRDSFRTQRKESLFFGEVPARFRLSESSKLAAMDYSKRGSWKDDLKLSESFLKAIEAMGLTRPNPMQLSVIPQLQMKGACVLCAAETGSGKTLAYLLPIMAKLKIEEESTLDLVRKTATPEP